MGQPTVGEIKMRNTNIPRRFWWKHSFEDWDEETVKKAQEWFDQYVADEHGGVGLYIAGPAGTGKTALSCLVGERLVMEFFSLNEPSVYFIRTDELVEWKRETFRISDEVLLEVNQGVIDNAKFSPVVILDDLGKEYTTESGFANNFLEHVIRSRFDEELPTIVTTNFTKGEFDSHFTESMESFKKEAFIPIWLTEKDRRAPE